MSAVLTSSVVKYICNSKCGEIRMTKDAKQFALICDYCAKAFTGLLEFIKHLQHLHCKPQTNGENSIKMEIVEETHRDHKDKSQEESNTASAIEVEYIIGTDPLEFVSTTLKDENGRKDNDKVAGIDEMSLTEEADQPTTTTTVKSESYKAQVAQNARLIYLINLLEEHIVLWNMYHPQYGNKIMRDDAYTRITNLINNKFTDKCYSKKIVVRMLNGLRELCKKIQCGKLPKVWYYDNLKFLNEQKKNFANACNNSNAIITSSSYSSGKNVSCTTKRSNVVLDNSNIPNTGNEDKAENNDEGEGEEETEEQRRDQLIQTKEVTLALIELFKEQRPLWDRTDENFYVWPARMAHYQRFAVTLNERFNSTFSNVDIRKRVRLLCRDRHHNKVNAPFYRNLSFIPRIKRTPYKCRFCAAIFSTHKSLEKHEYEHTKTKSIKCQQCNKTFITMEQLRAHQKIHLPKEQFQYLCDTCGDRFRSTELRKQHLYKEHNVPWPITCEVCNRGFSKQSCFIKHMRWHNGERPYLCTICGKSYTLSSALKEHLNRHAKLKTYHCTICENSYYNSTKLKHHMKVHYNIKDHECDVCGKKFVVRSNLITHKQIHSNERNYECNVCGQRFKQASSRAGHMRKHREANEN